MVPGSGSPPHRCLPALALAALAALVLAAFPATAVEVVPTSETLEEPLYGYGMARIDETTYLVGGANADRSFSDAIIALRESGSTSQVATLPTPLQEPAVAAVGSTVYIFGGAQEPGESGLPTTTAKILAFHPDTGEVEELVGTSLPDPVSSAYAVRMGGFVYVLGGLAIESGANGGSLDWKDTIARFDPDGPTVTELDRSLPTGMGQGATVLTGGSAYLVGGTAERRGDFTCERNASSCATDAVLRFRPDDPTVRRVATLPEPARWAGAVAHEGTLYVLGGCQINCGAHYGRDTIVTVDLETGAAETLPVTVPVKGGRHQATVYDGVAVLPGGVRANGTFSVAHDAIHRIRLGATPPWAPGNLTAGPDDDGPVRLDWDPPAYDGGAPVTGYRVLRATGAERMQLVERVEAPPFTDQTATLGTAYRYQVRAVNPTGIGAPSNPAGFTPTDTPDAPIVTARGGDGRIVVQWSPPTDTGGSNLTGYQLIVAQDDGNTSTLDCSRGACLSFEPGVRYFEVEHFGDHTVENGNTYLITVRAQNRDGYGVAADPVQAVANPVPDPPSELRYTKGLIDGEPVVNLTWRSSPSPETTGYIVHRGENLAEMTPIGETEYLSFSDDQEVPRGTEILYAIVATDGDREGPPSQPVHVVFPEPPAAVRDLDARREGGKVVVTWRPPASLGGSALDRYELARTRGAIDPEDADVPIRQVSAISYEDGTAPRGQPATYHVRAVTAGGAGPWQMTQVRVPTTDDQAPPQAVLSARPSNLEVGDNVAFDASGSRDDEGIAAYKFRFGDGAATGWQNNPRAAHAYSEKGVYTAELVVRDIAGLESEPATATIAVGAPPEDEPPEDPGPPTDENNGMPVAAWVPAVALLAAALVTRRR